MFSLSLHELRALPAARLSEEMATLLRAALTSDNKAANTRLRGEVREYEVLYEMSSETLLQRLAAGEVAETADIARWLFLLNSVDSQVTR